MNNVNLQIVGLRKGPHRGRRDFNDHLLAMHVERVDLPLQFFVF